MEKEPELLLLYHLRNTLETKPHANQRDLADAINMSLGMTNSLLKRFTEKGWLYVNKISAKNIQYALTPGGMNELARRSYRYLKRTMRAVLDYKELITSFIAEAKREGIQQVVLAGETDVQFIVEYACSFNSIPLLLTDGPSGNTFTMPEKSARPALVLYASSSPEGCRPEQTADVQFIDIAQILVR